jgi:ABC-type nitrate/sulfonate/bicarbonate transport system substrate-binding protein
VTLPPGYSDQAIRARLVDVVALRGIVQADAVSRGGIRELFSDHDLFGDATLGSFVMHPDFIADNPNTTRLVVGGIARAIDWLQRHSRADGIRLATAAAKRHDRPNDVATLRYWRSLGVSSPGGTIALQDVERWQKWLERTGAIPQDSVDSSAVFTNAFNPYARATDAG